jgi:hypothetical protein
MYAIETMNESYFEELGGTKAEFDLNFRISKEGVFPLMVACAKGRYSHAFKCN